MCRGGTICVGEGQLCVGRSNRYRGGACLCEYITLHPHHGFQFMSENTNKQTYTTNMVI